MALKDSMELWMIIDYRRLTLKIGYSIGYSFDLTK